jgi:chromosome segregation protein
MYLESIELFGFKTFVSNTKIVLSPHINCIVGPNGAGKSNIVDAVRWMLGEQRLSLLRAVDSTDLIFSGSSMKKQLSVASVKMVFNNESHTFSIKTPRLIIEKRIYRNREIHYYVNGEESTLQKINSIFHSANIFGHTYAIVGQGRVEEILLARAEEKKAIIDKVAGIDVYKRKKDEALKKLKEVDENLTRVSDRLSELRQHANHVLTEAKKAHMYYILSDRLKEEETVLLNAEIKALTDSIKIVSSGLEELEGENEEILASMLEKKKKLDLVEENVRLLNDSKEEVSHKKEKLIVEKTRLKGDESRLREKIEELECKSTENNVRLEKMEKTLDFLSKDIEMLNMKKVNLEITLAEKEKELSVIDEKVQSLRAVLLPLFKEEEERNGKLKILNEERVKLERLISVKETELKFLGSKKADLEQFVQSFEVQDVADENKIKEKLDFLYKRKKELSDFLSELTEKLALLRYKSDELKKFIFDHDVNNFKFQEKSLGAALGLNKNMPGLEDELNAIVLSNTEELKNYKEGNFFLGTGNLNMEVVKSEKIYPIEDVLGVSSKLLSGIYYSIDLKSALDFFKVNLKKFFIKKIITADGFIILSPFEVKINFDITVFSKSQELESINKELNDAIGLKAKFDKELLENESLAKTLEGEFNSAKEHNEKIRRVEAAKVEISSLDSRIAEIETEKELLNKKINDQLKEIELFNGNSELRTLQSDLDALKNEYTNKFSETREIKFSIEKVSSEIDEKARKIEVIKRDMISVEEEQAANLKIVETLQEDLNETLASSQNTELDLNEIEEKEKELKEALKDKLGEEKMLAVEISKIEERNQEILKRMEKQRIMIAQKETEINGLKNTLQEKGINEREILYPVNTETLRKEIKELKEEIRELGAIDFTSISEEEQITKELEEKESVYNDVRSSKKELEKFIEEMENKIKFEFNTTLGKIEENFSKFFKKMFKGGEAHFEKILDDFGEVKGIEINLRPPGKKNQPLHLLSGGEKTLAAIALLFSIFKVRPSPFYILDEVDAALDEENVVRFGELLGEESENAQFIVITHNRETMQRADILYGITMEEDGISKVVSLKFV